VKRQQCFIPNKEMKVMNNKSSGVEVKIRCPPAGAEFCPGAGRRRRCGPGLHPALCGSTARTRACERSSQTEPRVAPLRPFGSAATEMSSVIAQETCIKHKF